MTGESKYGRLPGDTGNGDVGVNSSAVTTADGRFVAFCSTATDLVAGQIDRNNLPDTFLRDRATGITVLDCHPVIPDRADQCRLQRHRQLH